MTIRPSVLHLASSYAHNPLYSNLINSIDSQQKYTQTVYIPVRTKQELKGFSSNNPAITEHFSYVLRKYHRVLYFRKRKDLYADLCSRIDIDPVNLVHAHYIFADGGLANMLYRKHGKPYIVTVRNVDLRLFFGKMFHLRAFGNRILHEASQIVLLSEAYRSKLLAFVPCKQREVINSKIIVLPNGIDEFWHKNVYTQCKQIEHELRFVFVGAFTTNKNINGAIAAIEKYQQKHKIAVSMQVIGGTQIDYEKVYSGEKIPNFVAFLGRVSCKDALKRHLEQAHVFIMPSFTETFGLVYAEAMSQGCPVLYTAGQGFDKQFKEGEVGYAVSADNIGHIADRIEKLVQNYSKIQTRVSQLSNRFKWEVIGREYADLYCKILD